MAGLLILLTAAGALLMALLTALLVREMRSPPRHTAAYAIARRLPTDPGDLGLAFDEWRLDRPDGALLPVWDVRGEALRHPDAQDGQTGKLTAILIHGWGHSRIDMLPRVPLFAPLCDRVVLYDLRGHGDAEGGPSRLGDREELDLLALIERLGDGEGRGGVLLVGHSMGAVIALRAAASDNARARQIAGIIAYSPYLRFHTSLCGRLRGAGHPARPITDLALLAHRALGVRPASLSEAELQRIEVPTLIVHGAADEMVPIAEARRPASLLPRAEVLEIAGAGHLDAHLIEAAQHDERVRQFIARLRAATSRRSISPSTDSERAPTAVMNRGSGLE